MEGREKDSAFVPFLFPLLSTDEHISFPSFLFLFLCTYVVKNSFLPFFFFTAAALFLCSLVLFLFEEEKDLGNGKKDF